MKITGNTLILHGELNYEILAEMEQNLKSLVEQKDYSEFVVDMQKVDYVTSPCIGSLLIAHLGCDKNDKKLKILMNRKCLLFFSLANLDKILNIAVI